MASTKEIYLVWKNSSVIINVLANLINNSYESIDNSFQLARNLEEDIRNLISKNSGMVIIDNSVFYVGDLFELRIQLLIRSGEEEIFPNLLLQSYGLDKMDNASTEILFSIIVSNIENSLERDVKFVTKEEWNDKIYEITLIEQVEPLVDEFEKSHLGVFLYLLYLRDLFKDNKDVCVVVSELTPLIKQVERLEKDIGTLTKDEFIKKNPLYEEYYKNMYKAYTKTSVTVFRFISLYNTLTVSGPFVSITRNKDTINTNLSKAFNVLLSRCGATNSRFTVSIVIMNDRGTAHANMLIIDHKNKTVERYEPNGYIDISLGAPNMSLLGDIADATDDTLSDLARKLGYKYEPPAYFCPKKGVQQIEQYFKGDIGYCVTWSILYGIERLTSSLPKEVITSNFLNILVDKYKLQGVTLKEKALALEQLMSDKVNTIFEGMEDVYKELSAALGINVKYEQGKLVYFK